MKSVILCLSFSASTLAFAPSLFVARPRTFELKANIVETAVSAGSFKTLVAAVTAAGLGPTLSGPGPFTVFAPSDEAFAKLPAGTVEGLLKDLPKLKSILTYHVISGKVPASVAVTMNGKKAQTVNGAELSIKVDKSGVMVDGAKVVTTDIMCDNGIIHVIDAVILPPAPAAPKVTPLNFWVPDAKKPCYGLPGAISPLGFFDPAGFCGKDVSLKDVKRIREAEVMHSRVAMMATVGYLIGESTPTPFGISGPANDQLAQVPLPLFALLTAAIGLAETFRATKGWVEPGTDSLFSLRDNYYPGDLGFDPLGFKPKNKTDFETLAAKELSNGRLAMIGVAGMCVQEIINHQTILPLQF